MSRGTCSRRLRVLAPVAVALAGALALSGCASLGSRPLPPRVEVIGVQRAAIDARDLTLTVVLNVNNPNAYAVGIATLQAEVAIEGSRLASARLPAPVTLAPAGDTRVEIDAHADLRSAGGLLERVLRTGRIAYEITGYAVLQDGRQLDYRRQGELSAADLLGSRR
jgi:LEA14-like dessication related protein